jgi:hypothetical protein
MDEGFFMQADGLGVKLGASIFELPLHLQSSGVND